MTLPLRPAPGSFAWLVAHDLRLSWRQFVAMFAGSRSMSSWAIGTGGLLTVHAVAWAVLDRARPIIHGMQENGSPPVALTIGLACLVAWLTAQGLLATARLLHDRGDLDLLLCSPLPPDRILAARAVALGSSAFGSAALLILPLANAGTLIDGPRWLALYPALIALSMIGTAVGSVIAIVLFNATGPRRARVASSVAAAVLAGALVLSIQIAALMPSDIRARLVAGISDIGASQPLAAVIAAVHGEPVALIGLLVFAVALFAVAVRMAGPAFARTAAGSAEVGRATTRHHLRDTRVAGFSTGLAASLRRKEWRLLVRDPNLLAQLSLQIIYTLPAAVVLIRSGNGIPTAIALGPVIVVIATQVAASLAWIAVSAEEAPELVMAAPVRQFDVNCAKLSAIALPLLLVVGGPLAGLALISLKDALLCLLFAIGGATSGALLNLWHPVPGKRRGMLRRHAQSKLVAMIEHLMALLWALAVALAVLGSPVTVVPLLLIVMLLAVCRRGWNGSGATAQAHAA
ncbi:MAG: hypothetical protein AB7O43_19255 [Hyphomicrobiaceae bacterium]